MAYLNPEKLRAKHKRHYLKNKERNKERRREYFRAYMKARYKRKILSMVGGITKLSDSIAGSTDSIRKNQLKLDRKIIQIKAFINIK